MFANEKKMIIFSEENPFWKKKKSITKKKIQKVEFKMMRIFILLAFSKKKLTHITDTKWRFNDDHHKKGCQENDEEIDSDHKTQIYQQQKKTEKPNWTEPEKKKHQKIINNTFDWLYNDNDVLAEKYLMC